MDEARYIGNFEGLKNGRITGWIKRSDSDQPVDVEIKVNGRPAVTITANQLRRDLAKQGYGKGLHGFSWEPPLGLVGQQVEVEVAPPSDLPAKLINPVRTVTIESNTAYVGNFEGVRNGLLTGWVKRTDSDAPVTVAIKLNGEIVDRFPSKLLRKDLFNQGVGRGLFGFSWAPPEHLVGKEVDVEIVLPDDAPSRVLNQSARLKFEATSITEENFWERAPWVDQPDALEELESRVREGRYNLEDYAPLRDFIADGYCVLRGVVDPALIDKFLADIDAAFRDRPKVYVRWPADEAGRDLSDIRSDNEIGAIRNSSFRFNSFHNTSEAAAEITLNPRVVDLVKKIFDGEVIATQSLTFENGTQQGEHMDFAFVHQNAPAFLVGAWVACEDIHSDSGPLFYYPGSHKKIPFFDFGGGNIFSFGDREMGQKFSQYLKSECDAHGVKKKRFLAGKGDVLIWHSALIHGGEKREQPITRRSYVSHFTRLDMCPNDKRAPREAPIVATRNGGHYHEWRSEGHTERFYPLPPAADEDRKAG